jgi:hypothetical protein
MNGPFIKYTITMKTILLMSALVGMEIVISCQKTITVNPPAYQSRPSIQCMLDTDSIPVLYLNRTVPYFDKKISFADLVIRGAKIEIAGNYGKDSLYLDSIYDKTYCQYNYVYRGSKTILPNMLYTLSVTIGSDVYSATTFTDRLKPVIDSVAYTPTFSDLYGEHEGIIVYFKDIPSQQNFYRYQFDRYVDTTVRLVNEKIASECLGKDSLLVHEIGRSVYSDEGQSGQELKTVAEPAYSHKKGVKGWVFIQNIDKAAYDFFNMLDKQKQSQFNPFVEPVFLQNGQFGTKAIGYFSSKVNSSPVSFTFRE